MADVTLPILTDHKGRIEALEAKVLQQEKSLEQNLLKIQSFQDFRDHHSRTLADLAMQQLNSTNSHMAMLSAIVKTSSDNQQGLKRNADQISDNMDTQSAHAQSLLAVKQKVDSVVPTVQSNAQAIASNTTSIDTNQSSIRSNTTLIDNMDKSVLKNQGDLSTHADELTKINGEVIDIMGVNITQTQDIASNTAVTSSNEHAIAELVNDRFAERQMLGTYYLSSGSSQYQYQATIGRNTLSGSPFKYVWTELSGKNAGVPFYVVLVTKKASNGGTLRHLELYLDGTAPPSATGSVRDFALNAPGKHASWVETVNPQYNIDDERTWLYIDYDQSWAVRRDWTGKYQKSGDASKIVTFNRNDNVDWDYVVTFSDSDAKFNAKVVGEIMHLIGASGTDSEHKYKLNESGFMYDDDGVMMQPWNAVDHTNLVLCDSDGSNGVWGSSQDPNDMWVFSLSAPGNVDTPYIGLHQRTGSLYNVRVSEPTSQHANGIVHFVQVGTGNSIPLIYGINADGTLKDGPVVWSKVTSGHNSFASPSDTHSHPNNMTAAEHDAEPLHSH